MKRLVVHQDAEEELWESVAFYEKRVKGLGLAFEAEIRRSFQMIQRQPELYAFHKRTPLQRFVVERFPFVIFYRDCPDHISIVAVANAKRRPGYWRSRQTD